MISLIEFNEIQVFTLTSLIASLAKEFGFASFIVG